MRLAMAAAPPGVAVPGAPPPDDVGDGGADGAGLSTPSVDDRLLRAAARFDP